MKEVIKTVIRKKFDNENEATASKRGIHGKTPIHAPDIYKSVKPSIFKNPHSDDEDGKMDKRRICSKGKEHIHPEDSQLATFETDYSTFWDKGSA